MLSEFKDIAKSRFNGDDFDALWGRYVLLVCLGFMNEPANFADIEYSLNWLSKQ